MDDTPQRIVAAGYDAIAERYLDWIGGWISPAREHALAEISARVPPGSRILDLGCGAGVPMTAALAERYAVHGVDISARQIDLARRSVPLATFEQADVTTLEVGPASYDAVVAFYSLTHVPREELPTILDRIRRWLRPGGWLVASFGVRDEPGDVEPDWLGAPMYFSHYDAHTNMGLVRAAGLDLLDAATIVEPEDDGAANFLWVTARRPETP